MTSYRRKMKQTRYLFYFVTRSLLITVFCFLSILCVFFAAYFGDLLIAKSKGNYRSPLFGAYIIVSPSMVPTIKTNDAIIIKRVDNDKYKIGDVITFASKDANYYGKAVTHRIVEKENYSTNESIYKTKGDNNNVADMSPVKTSDIYGKVLFKIPAVGKLQAISATPTNFFISLLIPTAIFMIYDMTRIFVLMSKRKA